jgi:hypothetical protein
MALFALKNPRFEFVDEPPTYSARERPYLQPCNLLTVQSRAPNRSVYDLFEAPGEAREPRRLPWTH